MGICILKLPATIKSFALYSVVQATIKHHPPDHLGLIIRGLPGQVSARVVVALVVTCVCSAVVACGSALEGADASALFNGPNLPVEAVSLR